MTRARLWAFAALVSFATCLHYPMMAVFRNNWTAKMPTYVKHWPNDGRYTLLGLFGVDNADETYSSAAVEEFARHPWPGDPYVDKRAETFPKDFVTYSGLALLHRVTGDMNMTWLLARLLAAFLWCVLLYRLGRQLGLPEPPALFFAAFGTAFAYLLGLYFLHRLSWLGSLPRTVAHALWDFVAYGRTENVWRIPRPGLSYPGLFLATLFWAKAAEADEAPGLALAGLFGGLLAYVRLDVWTGFVGAACFYPLIKLALTREFHWRWALTGPIALAVAGPLIPFVLHPPEDFVKISGMVSGRAIDWRVLFYFPLVGYALHRRKDAPTVVACALLLAVGSICCSALITNRQLYTPNWRGFGNVYAMLLVASLLPKDWLDRRELWRGATALCLLAAASLATLYAGIRYPWHGLPKAQEEALMWLKANAKPDATVSMVSPESNALLRTFTPQKSLVGPAGPLLSDVTVEENVRRVRLAVELLGGDARALFDQAFTAPPADFVRYELRRVDADMGVFTGRLFCRFPADEQRATVARVLAEPKAAEFPVDYVWVGEFERRLLGKKFPASSPRKLKKVFSNGVVDLYQL